MPQPQLGGFARRRLPGLPQSRSCASTPASGLPVRMPFEVPGGVTRQAQNVSDMP